MGLPQLTADANVTSLILLGLLGAIFARFLVNRLSTRSPRLPRGPPPIPILGNVLSLKEDDEFLDQLLSFRREYGPVYSLYIGQKLNVVVCGAELIREITVKRGLDFGDRPLSDGIWKEFNPKRLGIFEAPADEKWKNQRKFAHSTLRGMGFGKVLLEPLVQEEANTVIKYLKEKGGNGINPQACLSVSASNLITRLVIGQRLDHESQAADEFVTNVRTVMDTREEDILTLFPFLWPVMKLRRRWRLCAKAVKELCDFVLTQAAMRQKRLDASEGDPEVNDFIDAYLVQARDNPEAFTVENLVNVVVDLFLAGTDTTSTTLTWATIYLATNPEIQQRVHDEIVKVLGLSQVSMSHRSTLPYTQAVLLEVQRLAALVPLIPRMPATDMKLGGYDIPKGTTVLLNLWSLHHDPEVWPNPMTFDPDRFLDKDGNLIQSDNFLPFSAGKRNCMGEQFAKMELFIFFTSMVQQLKFSVPPGCEAPSYEGSINLVRQPKPFQLQVTPWPDQN